MTSQFEKTAQMPATLRRELEELIVGDLLGPAGGESETLPGRIRVRDRYLVGMLAPAGTLALDPERADGAGVNGDVAPAESPAIDDATAAQPNLFPSSFGFTCVAGSSVTELVVEAIWGRYRKEKTDDSAEKGGTVWQRHPSGGSGHMQLREGEVGPIIVSPDQPDVVVRGRASRTAGGGWLVTLFLVNEQTPPKINKDEAWLFQAKLAVEAPDGEAIFVGRGEAITTPSAQGEIGELQLLDMQYRNHVEFAAGHGVGVHAVVPDGVERARATRIETVVIPSGEVPSTEAPSADDPTLSDDVRGSLRKVALDMEVLSRLGGAELRAALEPLADAYEQWLDEQEARLDDPKARLADHGDAATIALAEARVVGARIRLGIDVVTPNPNDGSLYNSEAAEAFKFANAAMWLQRIHTLAGNRRRHDPDLELNDVLAEFSGAEDHSWRPFQLAFMLLNLPSLARPDHPERSAEAALVDLLFFPTGGGKTEAYLGLTAFTLAIRRLQGTIDGYDGRSGGVAVLMRYTLRLLTAQQFQRAAALICACEHLRREAIGRGDDRWGDTPFRLGMWVGSNVTPNTNIDAGYAIEDARGQGRRRGGRSSPIQLVVCPWCGSRLDAARDAKTDNDRWRTLLYCSDPFGACPFTEVGSPGEGIPVVTVDDELYRLLPSFIISTADKFAQLPWKGPLHMLFGRVSRRCTRHGYRSPDLDKIGEREERNSHNKTAALPSAMTVDCDPLRPPDLIIQDELHLISGPLGTLVGLYETAIDRLSSWTVDGTIVRPKVVASTATVRRAAEQVHALFERRLSVFPPPVLDVEHAFFAEQRPVTEESPGRRYLGVCAHGQRLKAVEVRVFTSLLASAQRLFERYGEAADPWMTLVTYFGALRELGGAKRLVDDDVKARLRKTDQRGLAKRSLRVVQELTSRISSTDIPDILDQLEERFSPPALGPDGKPIKEERDRLPIDVLLATSMISVGVDVGRLGLMCCVGQPKTTAEYIQSTSRVGRESRGPGLIVTIYNWARPRDLSHYETFGHYHATFYRHVEALSVTPFSSRALDRGLTALFVSLVRHSSLPAWNPNAGAQLVDVNDDVISELADAIAARAANIGSDVDVEAEVRRMIDFRRDRWKAHQTTIGALLGYKEEKGTIRGLLHEPTLGIWDEFSCPNSLRETEPTVNLIINDWQNDPTLDGAPSFQLGAGQPSPRPGGDTAEDEEVIEADAEAES